MKKFYTHLMFMALLFTTILYSSMGLSGVLSLDKMIDWMMPLSLEVSVVLDFLSLIFLFMVLLVSVSVFVYSWGYMAMDGMWNKFIVMLALFVLSMVILSLSSSVFFSILGWDGLGLTSVGLIFFFHSWVSFRSGMVTFVCNRMGDAFFIVLISLISVIPWSHTTEQIMTLVICAMTKSAQVPFHIWLPMAMAAPTPVSSLVHSSTLVTAGLYMIIRYGHMSMGDWGLLLFIASSMSLILSGVSSMFEIDVKKVIALSTLVHLSMMMIFVSLGDIVPALIHLVCHAFMKSGLFMVGGILIHKSYGSQDVRHMSNLPLEGVSSNIVMMTSLLSMVGLPFLSGFMSKEIMLGGILEDEKLLVPIVVLFLGLFFSMSYSIRLFIHPMTNHPFVESSESWGFSRYMIYPLLLNFSGSVMVFLVVVFLACPAESYSESAMVMLDEKKMVILSSLMALTSMMLSFKLQKSKKLSYSISKMNMFPETLSRIPKGYTLLCGFSESIDKEGVLRKISTSFIHWMVLSKSFIHQTTDGSKTQYMKLVFIVVCMYACMCTYVYGSKYFSN